MLLGLALLYVGAVLFLNGLWLMGKIGDQPTKLIQVEDDSVAARAGLEVGDVLLALNGVDIDSAETLRREFSPYRWGDQLSLRVERDGEPVDLLVPIRRSSD